MPARPRFRMDVRPQRARHFALNPLLWLLLILVTVLNTGCWRRAPDLPEPAILDTLPEEWLVVTGRNQWEPVNIDDDEAVEYLLLYTFDNLAELRGPVGATMYDQQSTSEYAEGEPDLPVPYQPSATYIPYRILPAYWDTLDDGFIARVQTAPIALTPVTRVNRAERSDDPEAQTEKPDELIIQGGGSNLTFVWWRGIYDGYGVAHIHAPGGFRGRQPTGEQEATQPILSIQGLYPFNDRSRLCHQVLYRRELAPDHGSERAATWYRRDIHYVPRSQGITFCSQAPTIPFYPEAIVLAYLERPDTYRPLLANDASHEQFQKDLQSAGKRVQALYAAREVHFNGSSEQTYANVCVELVAHGTDNRTTYNFVLQHLLPELEVNTSDRMRIVDMEVIGQDALDNLADCNVQVPHGTPGLAVMP